MSAVPASQTIRTPSWIAAAVGILVAVGFLFWNLLSECVTYYWLKPDYSHGFLVPIFSAYLVWHFRDKAPKSLNWPEPWGLAFLVACASAVGVPGTWGFWARQQLLSDMLRTTPGVVPVILAGATLSAIACVAPLAVFWRPGPAVTQPAAPQARAISKAMSIKSIKSVSKPPKATG